MAGAGGDVYIRAGHEIHGAGSTFEFEPGGAFQAGAVLAGGEALLTVNAFDDERFARFESVHVMKLRSVACVTVKVWVVRLTSIHLPP